MTDVFISYKREDEARVAPIVEGLRAAGLSVWWDRDISGGEAWRQSISEQLEAARCVIVRAGEGSRCARSGTDRSCHRASRLRGDPIARSGGLARNRRNLRFRNLVAAAKAVVAWAATSADDSRPAGPNPGCLGQRGRSGGGGPRLRVGSGGASGAPLQNPGPSSGVLFLVCGFDGKAVCQVEARRATQRQVCR